MPGEEAKAHWEGNIHLGEKSYDGEFVATTDRFLYEQGGMMADISYNHITSVKSGVESKEITNGGGGGLGAVIAGIAAGAGGVFIMMQGGISVTFIGLLVALFGGLLIYGGLASMATEVETTEKTIYHVQIMRDNERPLYLTTGENVGPMLRNLVARSKP